MARSPRDTGLIQYILVEQAEFHHMGTCQPYFNLSLKDLYTVLLSDSEVHVI